MTLSVYCETNNSLFLPSTVSKEALCIYEWCKPRKEELRRRELSSTTEVEDGEFCVWKKRKATKAKWVVYKAHSEEQKTEKETSNINYHITPDNMNDPLTLVALLKDCATQQNLQKGSEIHADLSRTGLLQSNVFVGSTLVSMYAKCGALARAQEVFDQMRVRNIVSWNILISGYARHGHGKQALDCFEQMKLEGLSPNSVTFLCILKACIIMGATDKSQEIHAEIVTEGLLENDIMVANSLVDMYAKFGLLGKALEVFDKIPLQDVVSWNALILGYAQHGHAKEALSCFEQMQGKGVIPNAVTFLSILKACVSVGEVEKGEEIHAQVSRDGMLQEDVVVGTALVDMYAKCGSLTKAQEVFDKLPVPNLISWTALIAGYAQHGHGEEALAWYKRMQLGGLCPNAVTFICVLKACGSVGASDEGQEIHTQIVKEGMLENDVVVGTALVDMYANCGLLAEAQNIFDEFVVRDVVSWNALLTGYTQHVQFKEALNCYEQMQLDGFSPNAVTFVCILKVCSSLGTAYKGQEVHAEITKDGSPDNLIIGTALLDMYANCGMHVEAQEVFDNLSAWDVVSWNALIAGYAQLGKDEIVFNLFNRMVREGIEPDLATFTIVLNMCSHTGLLDKAQKYFEMMIVYGIIPIKEHHTCMVDLFGRAGHVDNAIAVMNGMPFSDSRLIWQILLTACRNWGDLKLGKLVFEHAAQLDEKDAAAYVCMGNMYAAFGKQEDVYKDGLLRGEEQAWKRLGYCWWTDASDMVY